MAEAQDIFVAISGNVIDQGCVQVNPGNISLTGGVKHSYSSAVQPLIDNLTGLYDSRFDDVDYYQQV
jgi:hypothetical protein